MAKRWKKSNELLIHYCNCIRELVLISNLSNTCSVECSCIIGFKNTWICISKGEHFEIEKTLTFTIHLSIYWARVSCMLFENRNYKNKDVMAVALIAKFCFENISVKIFRKEINISKTNHNSFNGLPFALIWFRFSKYEPQKDERKCIIF